MLKVLPFVLLGALCFSNLGFINFGDIDALKNAVQVVNARITQNQSKQNNAQAAPVKEEIIFEDATGNPVQGISEEIVPNEQNILRLHWNVVPNAVKYEIFIGGTTFISFTNGIEIPVSDINANFQVNAISLEGTTLENKISIANIDTNPISPRTTTEFDKMKYPPVYPVYSWIPTNGADHYEIELIKDNKIVRRYFTQVNPQDDNFDFYDKRPVLEEGEYFWRVRGFNINNQPVTQWSTKDASNSFKVERQIRFCALGDSITHGGGAISVPPSTVIYNWENYCAVPIKNIGRSGDTTSEVMDRFENDVLPFRPEVLFIMAGVNDYRGYISAWESVDNLAILRDKCYQYGILPVFITPTPLNSAQIQKVGFVELPPPDWKERQQIICNWIRAQDYFIDVNEKLTDANGDLSVTISIDGLHPDAEGKRIIGETVSAWLDGYIKSK